MMETTVKIKRFSTELGRLKSQREKAHDEAIKERRGPVEIAQRSEKVHALTELETMFNSFFIDEIQKP
jgi:hypothetical protein